MFTALNCTNCEFNIYIYGWYCVQCCVPEYSFAFLGTLQGVNKIANSILGMAIVNMLPLKAVKMHL